MKSFYNLKKEFEKINNLKWVKAQSHGMGNVGITFENLLGKERENFPIADYEGIEIKTSIENTKRKYITLFSTSPDGPYLFQTKVLLEKYGRNYNELPLFKKFYARLTANEFNHINNYYMKIKIDYKKEKIILEVYNEKFQLIDNECFWEFKTIEEKLLNKIQYLAYITAEKKYTNRTVYFFYKTIEFYKLKTFQEFLNLLNKSIIKICFKVGVYKKGKKIGNVYDHGTGFEISKKDLLKLYEKINLKNYDVDDIKTKNVENKCL